MKETFFALLASVIVVAIFVGICYGIRWSFEWWEKNRLFDKERLGWARRHCEGLEVNGSVVKLRFSSHSNFEDSSNTVAAVCAASRRKLDWSMTYPRKEWEPLVVELNF